MGTAREILNLWWPGKHVELRRIRFRARVPVLTLRNESGGCMGKDESVLNQGDR